MTWEAENDDVDLGDQEECPVGNIRASMSQGKGRIWTVTRDEVAVIFT